MKREMIMTLMLLRSAVVAALCLCLMSACQRRDVSSTDDAAEPTDEVVADSTVYGRCGINTAMHTLEIITDDGDTVSCAIHRGDTTDIEDAVKGGLFVGDRLAVILVDDAVDGRRAERVINLTTLMGRWASLDRMFELQEGGIVISSGGEPRPWKEWRINNGHLVLSADTFDIFTLGVDSLWLENADGIYEYRRMRGQQTTVDE